MCQVTKFEGALTLTVIISMKSKKSNDDYLTVKQIAEMLGLAENTVRGYIRSGELTPVTQRSKKKRPYLVRKDVFEQWLKSKSTGGDRQ